MRKLAATVAAVAVVAVVVGTAACPAMAAPTGSLGQVNATAKLDADGTLHAQYDLATDGRAGRMSFTLPMRVRVDGDANAWQVLHHDSLTVRAPGGPVAFTATTTDDLLTVEVPQLPDKPVPVTITLDSMGVASATQVSWELPTFSPEPAGTTMTLRGPGALTAVDCDVLPSGGPCARTSNQSGATASAAVDATPGQHPRVRVTFVDGALTRDTRTLAERLTPTTWLRHWWPAVAAGVVALAGAVWWVRRRR